MRYGKMCGDGKGSFDSGIVQFTEWVTEYQQFTSPPHLLSYSLVGLFSYLNISDGIQIGYRFFL